MAPTQKENSVPSIDKIKLFVFCSLLSAIISLYCMIHFVSDIGFPVFQFYLLNVVRLTFFGDLLIVADLIILLLKIVFNALIVSLVLISVEIPTYDPNVAPLPGPNARTQVVYVYKKK